MSKRMYDRKRRERALEAERLWGEALPLETVYMCSTSKGPSACLFYVVYIKRCEVSERDTDRQEDRERLE